LVEKSHLQYLSLNFLKFKFGRLARRWEWLGNRKVSHTKIVSLTQQLDKDKSILDLVARSKKWQFLQTTLYIFNIPRKWFTSDRQLRLNSHDLLNGKHLNIDENYGRYRSQGRKTFSWNKSWFKFARGGNISLILRNCNGLTVSSTSQIANDPKLIFFK